MKHILTLSFLSLASATFAAGPLNDAAVLAEGLGVAVSPEALPQLTEPPAVDAPPSAAPRAFASEPLSGDITVSGGGFLQCSGGPRGAGSLSGWIDLRADVEIQTRDGASGVVPVNGSVYLSGSCVNGGGFVSGTATISGGGTLDKGGRAAGNASLSGTVSVSQYVSAGYVSISQNVFLSGQYDPWAGGVLRRLSLKSARAR